MFELALTNEQVTLVAALLAMIASLLSAGVSLYTTRLRRYFSERWWERKAESYTNLFEALFYIQLTAGMRMELLTGEASYSEAYSTPLYERSAAGRIQIQKAAATGAFLFSRLAAARIQRLKRELDDPLDSRNDYDLLQAQYVAVRDAIDELRPLALDGLRLS